ncbi:MAG TPA: undecaprenyl-phosphate glucose phosphotransferase [Terriglobia bacterium]|nr:undecaprenyl-phosphate glucose phosphotransferase [Terriglobia bacterium]
MIRSKLVFQQIALKLGLYGAFSAAYWMAYWLRFGPMFVSVRPDVRPSDYVLLYLVAALTWGALCRLAELDQLWMAANQARWLWGSVWVTAATLMAIFFGAFFVRTYSFSRLFIILLGLLNILFVMILPKVLLILAHRHSGPKADVRILIVGDGQCAERVAERVRENSWVPCKVIGYVAVGDSLGGVVRRLGAVEDLEAVCRREPLDEILVALPLAELSLLPELKRALAHVSVPSRLVCDFLKEVSSSATVFEFFGTSVVDLHRSPADSPVYAILKRSFDVVVAGILLALLSPVIALIAILVKLTSHGPVFFSQQRVGLHGRTFLIHKFRTMRVESQDSADRVWTTMDDSRRTACGAFLRQFNLDELPQLWNVVRGDMSLVGPRPERPHFVDKFSVEIEEYNVRHFLRSGITGWAQVNGWRGDTSIARRVECDLYYLQNWSFLLDLKILWLTLWRGFRDRNAY